MNMRLNRLILLTALLTILRCFNPFAPKLEESDQNDLIITGQTTPDDLLKNFKYAYVFKDSILYANLLDSSFVFMYFDPNQEPSGRIVSWGRDEDLKTTGRLFRNFNLIDLVWNTTILDTIYSVNDDLHGESYKTFNLTLVKENESLNITGTAIFYFKKCDFDDKWRITLWKDESDL